MQKARILMLLLGLCWFSGQSAQLLAQDQEQEQEEEEPGYDEDIPIESDWDGYMPELYSRGDQTFTISLGLIFPSVFYNNGKRIPHHFDPPVGGMGTLGYTYFFGAHYFLGAEVGIKFNYTLGQNTVFLIPIGLRTGYQFVIGRFEIPLSVSAGIAPQRYLNYGYFGFFMKGGGSIFYRFSPEWSFGLNTDWSWYPQRPKENGNRVPGKDMSANIIGLTVSARYHF
ncbi:MAG: hypothetical protein FWH38_06705 [Treponema sp.]|nr:hypothetical protein [Treponema sp.]